MVAVLQYFMPQANITGYDCGIAGKIAGIICAIVGPAFAALLWLSVTFSHRQEKAMVIAGVTQHIATSDITNNSTALIGTTHGEAQNQLAKSSLKLSLDTASDSQSGLGRDSMIQQSMTRSTSDTSRTLDRTASMASSIGRTPSEMQRIGLLGQLHRSAPVEEETTTEVLDSGTVPMAIASYLAPWV